MANPGGHHLRHAAVGRPAQRHVRCGRYVQLQPARGHGNACREHADFVGDLHTHRSEHLQACHAHGFHGGEQGHLDRDCRHHHENLQRPTSHRLHQLLCRACQWRQPIGGLRRRRLCGHSHHGRQLWHLCDHAGGFGAFSRQLHIRARRWHAYHFQGHLGGHSQRCWQNR